MLSRNILISSVVEFKDERGNEKTKINWWILGGSLVFVIFTLSIGSFKVPFAQEIVFIGSVIIILFFVGGKQDGKGDRRSRSFDEP